MDRFGWGLILIGACAIVIAWCGVYWLEQAGCQQRATLMGLQYDYGLIQGCMVRVGNQWFPLEYLRILDGKIIVDSTQP